MNAWYYVALCMLSSVTLLSAEHSNRNHQELIRNYEIKMKHTTQLKNLPLEELTQRCKLEKNLLQYLTVLHKNHQRKKLLKLTSLQLSTHAPILTHLPTNHHSVSEWHIVPSSVSWDTSTQPVDNRFKSMLTTAWVVAQSLSLNMPAI